MPGPQPSATRMVSVDADLSSGANGIACDAVTAARPKPIANAETARIFMDFPFSLMDGEIDRLNDAKACDSQIIVCRP
jgi:hypothetical protein